MIKLTTIIGNTYTSAGLICLREFKKLSYKFSLVDFDNASKILGRFYFLQLQEKWELKTQNTELILIFLIVALLKLR